jgi:beta-N-acetylhexosaminidase
MSNLSPVLDVNSNSANPVIGLRSFGADPEQVAELGAAMIRAYQENGVIATGKHFPGHGNTSLDSHLALPADSHSLDELRQEELPPFQRAVVADVGAIMTAHVLYPALDDRTGIPATLSKPILEDLLRRDIGYTGLIATDSLGMGALDQRYGILRASQMAFEAGGDLLMYGNDPGHDPLEAREVYDFLLSQVEQGNIPEARVNDSVRRILAAKARYGILAWEPVDVDEIPRFVGTEANLAKAREIAREAITPVKNEDQLLPLDKGISLAVVSPDGILAAQGIPEEYASNVVELATSLDPPPSELAQIVQTLSAAGVDVVVLGTINAVNYPGQVRLAMALADYPLVVVALGLPYDLAVLPDAGTYLVTYGFSPPTLDVLPEFLFGQAQPAGHLPVPISPEYPIGFGITNW